MQGVSLPSQETQEPSKGLRLLQYRHSGILFLCAFYTIVCFLLRAALVARSWESSSHNLSLYLAFPIGFIFDLFMALIMVLPLSLALILIPSVWMRSWIGRMSTHLLYLGGLWIFLFGAVSEWIFWGEFDCRFNFIAVDYLVYTYEVVQNIRQSFPVPLILTLVSLITLALYGAFLRLGWMKLWLESPKNINAPWSQRFIGAGAVISPIILALIVAVVAGRQTAPGTRLSESLVAGLREMENLSPATHNAYNKELGKNGNYALVAAFFSNALEYERFYSVLTARADQTSSPKDSFARLRTLLAEDNATFVSEVPSDITRHIQGNGPAKRLNVIQITIEGLSYEFMGRYNFGESPYAGKNLTPTLDKLSEESVFFNRMYACGTRTVRGMESLALSLPPTPGQAILRRANNENLFSLPGLFKQEGYDSVFLYGGDGYFDNMNYFFSHNGCRVVDRPVKDAEGYQPTFANAWGVCDEDLYEWVLSEADKAYAAKTPFYHFVMTTSNHRPFTWPEGKTRNPLGTIEGAVEYTDLAIHNLLEKARTKPWFKDTVFVIVADHDMKVAGKQELVVKKYEIPLIIYSPAHLEPRQIETLCSQMDFAPTLLGLLNWTYDSKFLGRDQSRPSKMNQRAFISNYQKVGCIIEESAGESELIVLMPTRREKEFGCELRTGALTLERDAENAIGRDWDEQDSISYYQTAAWLFNNGLYGLPSKSVTPRPN